VGAADQSTIQVEPAAEPVTDKWELWNNGTRLRGAVLHPCRLFTVDSCIEPVSQQDIQDLRDLNANLINASYPGIFTVEPPYQVNEAALTDLDKLIEWAEEVGLYVVIHYRTGPGRSEGDIVGEGIQIDDVWRDSAARGGWSDMWRFTAERYRDSPVVVGYNLMVEPHPNTLIDPDGELEPPEVQAKMQGTNMDWNSLAAEITGVIRQVDSDTPIIINSLNWASAEWFPALQVTGDPRTIYSHHAYDPDVYTNQDEGEDDIHYPDVVEESGESIEFDRSWLVSNYLPVREFGSGNQVPGYVGEFGALRWVPGGPAFLEDQIDIFEENGWNHAVYVWRGDEPEFDGFSLEFGPDPENHELDPDNPFLTLLRESWSQNRYFPEGSGNVDEQGANGPSLADVKHWLYLIDVNLAPEVVEQIVDSEHDMVVLDFIPSEANNTDFPMAELVDQLHNAPHPKIVVAYIDIGQAEEFRTYWQPGWGVGNPSWIAGEDPDGWEGNFPVAYWDDEYREIWLGAGGMLEEIVDAGLDGVYLDWVEAYSDEQVLKLAAADGVDPVQEMIWWVGDIADFGRDSKPGFIVIAQNAAELAEHDEYVAIINAIAQEQVWFDGGADNDPPGDCPLPRTDEDVDSDAYRDSLSPACKRQFDDFPESTLHVSSQEYLYYLLLAQEKGVPIFTVDYALEPENVGWIFDAARSLGFVPFVGSRALDGFVEPFTE
jgi:cysteinyl-tRNA synthetase